MYLLYFASELEQPWADAVGMAPRYKVTLTEQERGEPEALARSGKTAARKFIHARALLQCDAGPHGTQWKVAAVAGAPGINCAAVENPSTVHGPKSPRIGKKIQSPTVRFRTISAASVTNCRFSVK
jgi:hypothetical protein